MATYTDVAVFHQRIWAEDSVERRFVQEAAEIAYEYINSALSAVYSVPFTTTPSVIETISDILTKVVCEKLILRGSRVTVQDVKEAAPIDPFEWLQDLVEGKKSIPGESRTSGSSSWVSTADQMHIFDIDHEIYHEPDSDRLDDLVNDRSNYP